MERNIKLKHIEINMIKKLILILVLVSVCIFNSFADELQVIHYNFEEDDGNALIIDSSGYSNHAVHIFGGWSSVAGQFGTGINMNAPTTFAVDTFLKVEEFPSDEGIWTGNFWYRPNTFSGVRYLMSVFGNSSIEQSFYVTYSSPNQISTLWFRYRDNASVMHDINLTSYNNTLSNWKMLTFIIDFPANEVYYSVDGSTLSQVPINSSQPINYAPTTSPLRFGASPTFNLAQTFEGRYDEIRIFNYEISQTDILNLFYFNNITLSSPDEELVVINGTSPLDIINTYTPSSGEEVINAVKFDVTLNYEASCDLYVDNVFIHSVEDILAFTYYDELSIGSHQYFLYCSFVSGDTLYYDVSNPTYFDVITGENSVIQFVFTSSEFSVSDYPLFMVTPCLNKGIYLPLVNNPYPLIANLGGVYFAPVSNDIATFNLTQATYDFCLIHGYGQYNVANGFSDNWHINKVFRQLEIGDFDIPSNVTKTFGIEISNSDLYYVSNPQWWGTSWTTIITGVIGFLVGLALIGVGVVMKLPQAIVIGGIVTLISLGFQLTPLLIGIVT